MYIRTSATAAQTIWFAAKCAWDRLWHRIVIMIVRLVRACIDRIGGNGRLPRIVLALCRADRLVVL